MLLQVTAGSSICLPSSLSYIAESPSCKASTCIDNLYNPLLQRWRKLIVTIFLREFYTAVFPQTTLIRFRLAFILRNLSTFSEVLI